MTTVQLVTVVQVLLASAFSVASQNVFVVAPNAFRLAANETVGIIVAKGTEDLVLYIQDFPGRKNIFSKTKATVSENNPKVVYLRVTQEDIPDLALSSLASKHHVLLVVEGKRFRKEVKVLVNLHSGYLFVQTDKPIYTPSQTVNVRIIPLNEEMLTSNSNFTVEIRNPQNIIVDHIPSKNLNSRHGLYSYNFGFPSTATEGEWSVVIKYGHKVPKNETLKFELREYALPTYEVKLKVPEVILPTDEVIEADVEARYVYGETVQGSVKCKFGVKAETKHTVYVGNSDNKMLQDGKAKCLLPRAALEEHKQVGWFPSIAGNRLLVEAVVTERATGEKENKTSSNTLFSKTKYFVDFKRCLSDFRPGLVATVQADIKEATGKKAANVLTRIDVKDQKGNVVIPEKNKREDRSDEEGMVTFLVPVHEGITSLHITVYTDDEELENRLQGTGRHTMLPHTSGNFVALDRTSVSNSLTVGRDFFSNVYSNPKNLPISYVVTTGGRVVDLGSLLPGEHQRTIRVQITDQMVPSMRVTLFAVHQGKTLTDSIKIDVHDECRAQAKIHVQTSFQNGQPGDEGSITVHGTHDTVVGILAIDKAVYALRNKGLLTKEKMFSKMEEHDLGCGPGGGLDNQQILANAGLLIISDSSTSAPERPSCSERKLRKREIREDVLRQEADDHKPCCKLGTWKDKFNRSCQERAEIVRKFYEDGLCADAFLRCCLQTEHLHIPMSMIVAPAVQQPHMGYPGPMLDALGRINLDEEHLDFVDENDDPDNEENTQERNDFRETWLFDTGVIGSDNRWVTPLNVPHSITTWMIQAVGVHPRQGMCVAEPVEAVISKKLFIQLKLPYSIIRNEQVELRATIFNYETRRLPVVVYMYGVDGICSEAQPNDKGERKKIYVSGNGGAETVAFPVVPLQIGKFPIKVVALSPKENDKIIRTLNVVAEGIPQVEDIVIHIDPSNLDKRKKRHIVSEKYETRIDSEQKQQFSSVKLNPKQPYVPGTESCHITAIGDKFGPTIHTALNNPDQLIRMPKGCGEQTMAFLAPTLYTLHYLKITGKMTAVQEANGYKFIREGYKRELDFRKPDGSYAAFPNRPSSTWLTAFVAKVFCQANKYVFIDENTMCSALHWLTTQQNPDGSFTDKHPVIHKEMTGGIKGAVPMTAFITNAFFKCDCNQVDLTKTAKEKAVEYLIAALPNITDPYHLAIVAYALSLTDPAEAGFDANQRLLGLSHVDEELNHRYWGQPGTAVSVEATSFALLTQIIHSNKDISGSIVNWLNTQRTTGGSFWSTQDTVIALEALAEYSIYSRDPEMSLSCNLTSSSDVNFKETIDFRPENARFLRSYELKKLGGRLHLEAVGTGVSTLGVKLMYNIPKEMSELCKFEITANVTDAKEIVKTKRRAEKNFKDMFEQFPEQMVDELALELEPRNSSVSVVNPRWGQPASLPSVPPPLRAPPPLKRSRVKDMMDIPQDIMDLVKNDGFGRRLRRSIVVNEDQRLSNSKYVANISVCVQYLYHQDSNMAILDIGIFTGFKVDKKDLARIVDDPSLPVSSYDEAGRSVIFYLDQVSHREPTCFWFRAAREFIVSHMESSVITVYDYYDPNQACSLFFSPNQHSAIIKTVCTEKVCQCAEGGCPPKQPFNDILKLGDETTKQRKALLDIACDQHEFVWKVKVEKLQSDASSFQTIDVRVLSVLKEGRESREDILVSPDRQFLGRRTCESAQLVVGNTYIIMGNDNEPVEQEDGKLKYTYYINKQSSIYEWFNIYNRNLKKTKSEKNLQKVFMWLENRFLKNEGCIH